MEELHLEWNRIVESKPLNPCRKPTPEELAQLKAYKQRVEEFKSRLPANHTIALKDSKPNRPVRQRSMEQQQSNQESCVKLPPEILLKAKSIPVCIGWTNESFQFHYTIPFLSHRRRSAFEKQQDEETGINRCVFSNLFMETLYIAENPQHPYLLGHASAYTQAMCSESFYMAAKTKYECDARFIMYDLKDSKDVAWFGHSKLPLTTCQKNKLVEYGASPNDFLKVDDDTWLRGSDGKFPVRQDWNDHRHNVFLYLLRHKFRAADSESGKTMQAILQRIKDHQEYPLLVEHRQKDSTWGDGKFGDGLNLLGRILTQIVLEFTNQSPPATYLTLEQVEKQFIQPNKELVEYCIRE